MTRPFSLSSFNDLLKRLNRASGSMKFSIFLDFDGTLTPVAGHPGDASLSESMREIIISLKRDCRVVIISGRALEDLKEKISIEGLTYVGNHGMEMSDSDFSFIYDIGQLESEAIKEVAGIVSELTASFDGAVLEEKGLTLSIHYRLVSKTSLPLLLKRLDQLLRPFSRGGLIKKTYGKGLVEIRPTARWNKGSAVEWLMGRKFFESSIPLCIGDDETDEDAFRVVRGRGISIFVGKRKSVADLYVPGQSGVEPMLAILAGKVVKG